MNGNYSNLDTRDGITSSVVSGVGGRSLSRGTHAILVIFANEDTGQVPKLGHVEGFKNLTLIASTVTVEGEGGNVGFSGVLLSEGNTSAKWNLGTDDTVSSEEGRCEDVHRAALSIGHAVLTTEEFGQYTLYGPSP